MIYLHTAQAVRSQTKFKYLASLAQATAKCGLMGFVRKCAAYALRSALDETLDELCLVVGTTVLDTFVKESLIKDSYGATAKAWAYQSSGPGNQPISTTTVNDGQWHHVADVFDVSTGFHSIYVDGAPVEDSRLASAMQPNTADFIVGGIHNSISVPISTYTGLVDDLQLYTSALSDTDINFLSTHAGSAVPEPASLAALTIGALALIRRRRA